jgi:predicted 3-demethylubiquinone-9 3-methyltransferase (glyoxalase superfamily)
MKARLTTLLMFDGRAEAAMRFYESLLAEAAIERIERYGADGPGAQGTVKHAVLRLGGQRLICIDSPIKHPFGFTPAVSLVLVVDAIPELDALFARLSEDGQVLVPLDAYPFNPRFGWVTDRFGVSWQLSVEVPDDAEPAISAP